jgi:hypothetical protein
MLVIFFTYQNKKSLQWLVMVDERGVPARIWRVRNSKGIGILFLESPEDEPLSDCIPTRQSNISVQYTDKNAPNDVHGFCRLIWWNIF